MKKPKQKLPPKSKLEPQPNLFPDGDSYRAEDVQREWTEFYARTGKTTYERSAKGGRKSGEHRRANSKSERVRRHLARDPGASNAEIAERVGCHPSLVGAIRRKLL